MPVLQMPTGSVGSSNMNKYQSLYSYDSTSPDNKAILGYFGQEFELGEGIGNNYGSTIIDNILYFKCSSSSSLSKIYMYNIDTDTISEFDMPLSSNYLYTKYIVGHTSDNKLCLCRYNTSSSSQYDMSIIDLETKQVINYTYPTLYNSTGGICVDSRTNTVYTLGVTSAYYESIYSRKLDDTTSAWTLLTQCGSILTNQSGSIPNLVLKEVNDMIYWISSTVNSNQLRVNRYSIQENKYYSMSTISNISLSITAITQPLVSIKEDGSIFIGYCYGNYSFVYYSMKKKDNTFISSIIDTFTFYYRNVRTFQINDNICLCSSLNNSSSSKFLSKAYSGLIYFCFRYVLSSKYKTFISTGTKICTVSGISGYYIITVDTITGEFNLFDTNNVGNNLVATSQVNVGFMNTNPLYIAKNDTLVITQGVDLIVI